MEARSIIDGVSQMALPIADVFLKRRSSRSIQDKPISYDELMSIFEVARWAPSSFNSQPWRFTDTLKDTKHWHEYFSLLEENNKK